MAIETQNGDYNLYASAATIYNKTAAADHDLTLEIRFGDGTKNLNTGVGTLTITVINDGGVEGGDSQVVYKGSQTRTVIRTGKLRVSSGKTITITAQSSNSNDTDIDVTVTPRWELQADSHGAAFSNLLFESTVVSYETSEFGTNLYIDGGPNQSGCFNRATVVVYDASNSNAPSFRQVVVSEFDDGDTYLAVSSAFDFTPVAGDLVRVLLNPREMALLPIYDPAKTAAKAGDEMALTASARTTLVAELEAEIADDATGEAVKQAIIAKLIENLPDLDDLSLAAIAESCAAAILATPAYKLVTDASGAVATDTASRAASKNTASEIRTAVGLATANLDTQLGAKATSDELAALETHGDSTWATATGFATSSALAAAVTKIDTIDGNVDAILEDTSTTLPDAIEAIESGSGVTATEVRIEMDANSTKLASIKARTDLITSIGKIEVIGPVPSSGELLITAGDCYLSDYGREIKFTNDGSFGDLTNLTPYLMIRDKKTEKVVLEVAGNIEGATDDPDYVWFEPTSEHTSALSNLLEKAHQYKVEVRDDSGCVFKILAGDDCTVLW